MIKYFHELSKKEFGELCKTGMTWGELAEKYPQPEWCGYPGATEGVMGCWGLVYFYVHEKGEDYCKNCDLYHKFEDGSPMTTVLPQPSSVPGGAER